MLYYKDWYYIVLQLIAPQIVLLYSLVEASGLIGLVAVYDMSSHPNVEVPNKYNSCDFKCYYFTFTPIL